MTSLSKIGLREAIVALHTNGKSNREIVQELQMHTVSYNTVYNTVKRFQETGQTSDRPRKGRPRSVRNSERIKRVREKVRRNPARSMRKLAKEEGVSHTTMQRIVKKDLNLIPYKKVKVQLLSKATKAKRLTQSKVLLDEVEVRPEAPDTVH